MCGPEPAFQDKLNAHSYRKTTGIFDTQHCDRVCKRPALKCGGKLFECAVIFGEIRVLSKGTEGV
jgi:hypothetical protein